MDSAQTLDDEQVVRYLLIHQDFFIRNSRSAAQMVVPHPVRDYVSLLEWQLGLQRTHIQQLEDDITRLMEHTGTNEALFNRLLQLQSDRRRQMDCLITYSAGRAAWDWRERMRCCSANNGNWPPRQSSRIWCLRAARHESLRNQRLSQGNHYLGKLTGLKLLLLP